jgi:hypothetical protein
VFDDPLHLTQGVLMSSVMFYTVVAFVAYSGLQTAREHRHAYSLVRRLRPAHFVANVPVLTATVVLVSVLVQLPGLGTGWFDLVGGRGNVALGLRPEATGWSSVAVPAAMITAFALAAPALVHLEEEMFRRGSERRSRRARFAMAALFGIVHLVAGVPLGAALALTLPGLWFTRCYLSGVARHRLTLVEVAAAAPTRPDTDWDGSTSATAGVATASLAHLAWNYTVIAAVAMVLVLGLI